MFSPQPVSAPATGTRGAAKRRSRHTSNGPDSLKAEKPHKRARIDQNSFVAPDAAPEMEETKNTKVATLPRQDISKDPAQREIVVRGKPPLRSSERVSKGDGTTVLVCLPVCIHREYV